MPPHAHRPPTPEQREHWRLSALQFALFFPNLNLILAHERDILSCDDYFFCRPEFSGYGIYSSAHINVGTLLLGWRHGLFIDTCRAQLGLRKEKYSCGGKSYVYHFGGLLSGTGWSGYCSSCGNHKFVWESTLTHLRMNFASSANRHFKDRVEDLEEFEGTNFSFGPEALVPAIKTRKVTRSLVEIVSIPDLVNELQTGCIRPPTAKSKTLLTKFLHVDYGENRTSETIQIIND
jgi:hypothetical protein